MHITEMSNPGNKRFKHDRLDQMIKEVKMRNNLIKVVFGLARIWSVRGSKITCWMDWKQWFFFASIYGWAINRRYIHFFGKDTRFTLTLPISSLNQWSDPGYRYVEILIQLKRKYLQGESGKFWLGYWYGLKQRGYWETICNTYTSSHNF